MAKNNNGNNEEKKTLEVDIPESTIQRLNEYSENADKSVASVVNEGINNEITRCEVKEILSKSCQNEDIPPTSKICRALAAGHHY
ncbi:MAG TPA: hypothetical protein VN922_04175 [Bacteroidia bacterium]|nr:hypothetical protein [Bacteroidia bacterium]